MDCLPCSALDSGGRCLLMSYCPATAVCPQICLYMTASGGSQACCCPSQVSPCLQSLDIYVVPSLSSLECTGLVSTVACLCEERLLPNF